MKFTELKWEGNAVEGIQAIVELENGFEVSVVRNDLSYGNQRGLYEIGVFNASGGMCDPLGWGDDVKGWLKPEDVEKELDLIASL